MSNTHTHMQTHTHTCKHILALSSLTTTGLKSLVNRHRHRHRHTILPLSVLSTPMLKSGVYNLTPPAQGAMASSLGGRLVDREREGEGEERTNEKVSQRERERATARERERERGERERKRVVKK
jgi:hypothetical protein